MHFILFIILLFFWYWFSHHELFRVVLTWTHSRVWRLSLSGSSRCRYRLHTGSLACAASEMGSHFHGSPDRTLVKPFWSVKLRWMVTASGIQRNICSLFEVAVLHILQQKLITSPTQVFSYQLFMKLHASMVDLHKFSFHYSTKAEANNCVEKGYILLL